MFPADGGGGGQLINQLDPIFTEIGELLGELAGNEAAGRVLEGEETRSLNEGWTREPGHFTFPGTYGFETPALYVAMHPSHADFNSGGVTNAEREKAVQDAVTQVWNEARDSWSSGIVSGGYRSLSQNVWEPDPGRMSASVHALSSLTLWLKDQNEPDAGWASPGDGNAPEWLTQLQRHWPATSASPQSFYAFWTDVNDKCSHYLHAAARLTATSAQVTATISDYQTNLLKAAEKTRDRVKEALRQWRAWQDSSGAWPTGAMQDNSDVKEILGHAAYGTGVIALIPLAAPVAGPLSLGLDTASYLVPAKTEIMEATQAATAHDIHNGFTNDVRKIEGEMKKALDVVRTQKAAPDSGSTTGADGFESYVAEVVGNRRDWSPPPVDL